LWCRFSALGRVVDPRLLGYLGWSGAVAEAFGVAVVCLGESDGPLVADLLGDAEVDGGGCVPADARVPVLVVVDAMNASNHSRAWASESNRSG
jgi:hypothetical protein